MTGFIRYAIYFAPDPGPLATFGARWLGWDLLTGTAVSQLRIDGFDTASLTQEPRKYGFHATIKPPFTLANGFSVAYMSEAIAGLSERLSPVALERLSLIRLGGFLALVPSGETAPLNTLAAEVVRALDEFRAPLTPQQLAKRLTTRLTERQTEMLHRWGYPYVMEDFRFHMTLTGRTPRAHAEKIRQALQPLIAPCLPEPVKIDSLCLVGQDQEGMFRLIQRFPLGGLSWASGR